MADDRKKSLPTDFLDELLDEERAEAEIDKAIPPEYWQAAADLRRDMKIPDGQRLFDWQHLADEGEVGVADVEELKRRIEARFGVPSEPSPEATGDKKTRPGFGPIIPLHPDAPATALETEPTEPAEKRETKPEGTTKPQEKKTELGVPKIEQNKPPEQSARPRQKEPELPPMVAARLEAADKVIADQHNRLVIENAKLAAAEHAAKTKKPIPWYRKHAVALLFAGALLLFCGLGSYVLATHNDGVVAPTAAPTITPAPVKPTVTAQPVVAKTAAPIDTAEPVETSNAGPRSTGKPHVAKGSGSGNPSATPTNTGTAPSAAPTVAPSSGRTVW